MDSLSNVIEGWEEINTIMDSTLFDGWVFLAVDDNPHTLNLLDLLLRHHGAEVYTATNGVLGLESAHKAKPDVILTDIQMPVMDGLQMIKQVESNPNLSHIPILIMLGHDQTSMKEKERIVRYHTVTKPIYAHTFIETLLDILKDIPELAAKLNQNLPDDR